MDRQRIYIVEDDLFVSEDMIGALHSVLPSAECIVFETVTWAHRAARGRGDPSVVVISAGADGSLPLEAEEAAWLGPLRVITFDLRDRGTHPDWVHLDKPFTEEQLAGAVRHLLSRSGSSRAAE